MTAAFANAPLGFIAEAAAATAARSAPLDAAASSADAAAAAAVVFAKADDTVVRRDARGGVKPAEAIVPTPAEEAPWSTASAAAGEGSASEARRAAPVSVRKPDNLRIAADR